MLNQAVIVGSMGNIRELRHAGQDKIPVLSFGVANTVRERGDDGEWYDKSTVWFNCTAWGRLAENIAKCCKPGDRVVIVAEMRHTTPYTNNDGVEVPARIDYNVKEFGFSLQPFAVTIDRERRSGQYDSPASEPTRRPAASKPAVKLAPAPQPTETAPKPEPQVSSGGDGVFTYPDESSVDELNDDDLFTDDFFE